MASTDKDKIIRSELFIDEKLKPKPKYFYKDWRTYAIALGILIISGTAVGIYYGINAANIAATTKSEQAIATGINDANYHMIVSAGAEVTSVTDQITTDFIQAQLTGDIKNGFNSGLFTFNKVSVAGVDLNKSHLATISTLTAKINYNYGSITNQETNLTIVVTTDQQIVAGIGEATYEITTVSGSTTEVVTKHIDANFIFEQLSADVQAGFEGGLFTFNKVSVANTDLDNSHLLAETTITAKINYNYGSLANQETNLTIIVSAGDREIVTAINKSQYKITIPTGSDIAIFAKRITPDFMRPQLGNELNEIFVPSSFKFNKITIAGKDLQNSDLANETVEPLVAKINYDYGSYKGEATTLAITVNNAFGNLAKVFEDFIFEDNKGVKNFLDFNDQTTIESQILNHLNESSFAEAGLTLAKQPNNSVLLTANVNSPKYDGAVTLSWNLKLFEVWGIDTDLPWDSSFVESRNKAELKGYFYLNKDQQIQYFDIYGYITDGRTNEVTKYDWLHHFIFTNDQNETRELKFERADSTSDLPGKFEPNPEDPFNLTTRTTVKISTSNNVHRNVRFFDPTTKTWSRLDADSNFAINGSGLITKIAS